jgi:hypothetical protein
VTVAAQSLTDCFAIVSHLHPPAHRLLRNRLPATRIWRGVTRF